MAEDLYREPSRKAQRNTLLYLATFALMILLLWPLSQHLVPAPDASLEEIQAGAELLIVLALCVTLIASVFGIFWIGYFVRLGYRALKHGIYPPPGTVVVRRTRVRIGKEAAVSAYLSIAFAALMVAPLVLARHVIWLLYSVP